MLVSAAAFWSLGDLSEQIASSDSKILKPLA
jgi:hypothetical protein